MIPVATVRVQSTGEPVTVVACDENLGISVFSIARDLPTLPAALMHDAPIARGDLLTELDLAAGGISPPHPIGGLDEVFESPFGERVPHAVRLEGTLHFSSVLLKEGRVAGVFLNNARYKHNRELSPYFLPMDRVKAAFAKLTQPP